MKSLGGRNKPLQLSDIRNTQPVHCIPTWANVCWTLQPCLSLFTVFPPLSVMLMVWANVCWTLQPCLKLFTVFPPELTYAGHSSHVLKERSSVAERKQILSNRQQHRSLLNRSGVCVCKDSRMLMYHLSVKCLSQWRQQWKHRSHVHFLY